ncbi:MAG: FG-GAP repeat protein [Candidatus Eisenbacteria bacterium]|uniref:FG-GAP repeat protein n=1 Tax=Eiseniibacteriota bacterium TaxID=2212470 RepID=A0A956RQ80_UNCEI|nr:FG-GAP repeat protein [Candidatus Eisenbacteria bacterium]
MLLVGLAPGSALGSGVATTPAWTGQNYLSGSRFGASVASAGDINGDGFDDVIVGAPYTPVNEHTNGHAYVYLGSAAGLEAFPTNDLYGPPARPSDFGFSVASAGDVNDDGFDDVIIGAPRYDAGDGPMGAVFIYLGAADGVLTAGPVYFGEQLGAEFGRSVSGAGDVNGDGFSDFVVGAPYFLTGDAVAVGKAYVFPGSIDGGACCPVWTKEGEQTGAATTTYYYFGYSVGSAGDVDGDGYSDVVVGAPQVGSAGRAYVFKGWFLGIESSPYWTADGTGFFGWSVGTAGDVDGDSFDDIIVGDPFDGNGRVHVFHGDPGSMGGAAWSESGGLSEAGFGGSVATAGDVDGDGRDDIVIGAGGSSNGEAAEGRAFFLQSPLDTNPGGTRWQFAEGGRAFANLGESVATAGDVNGDGLADVIVGAPGHEGGRAYVYYGCSGVCPVVQDLGVDLFDCNGDLVTSAGGSWMGAIRCSDGYFVFDQTTSVVIDAELPEGASPGDGMHASGNIGGADHFIVGTDIGLAHAFDANGNPMQGWPVDLGTDAPVRVAIGELGPLGEPSIIVASGLNLSALDIDAQVVQTFASSQFGWVGHAIADVDGDGENEIVAVSSDAVAVFRLEDSEPIHWSLLEQGRPAVGAPSIADLDGDGKREILIPGEGAVYGFGSDLGPRSGFPLVDSSWGLVSPIAIAVTANDADPNIAFTTASGRLYVVDSGGAAIGSFPQVIEADGFDTPPVPVFTQIGDGAENAAVLAGGIGRVHGLSAAGDALVGWPVSVPGAKVSVASGDVDGDGEVEYVFQGANLSVWTAFTPVPADRRRSWSMAGHDARRSGCLDCEPQTAAVEGALDAIKASTSFAIAGPNPTHLAVSMRYELATAARVSIAAFDVSGRSVREVLDRFAGAGVHHVSWDGRDDFGREVVPGAYYLRLKATVGSGTALRTEKVVVLR